MEQEERKNVLNRQYTTLVLHYLNSKGQPAECYLIDHKGWIHYGKPCVDSCHWEYDNYNRLVFDLERKSMPKEMLKVLFLKKRLFSKKKDVYENCSCSWEDIKISKKSFVKLVFNQEYKEDKNSSIQSVIKNLPVEELFLFAQDHCDGLRCYSTIDEYINRQVKERTSALQQVTESLMQTLNLANVKDWPNM